MMHKQEYPFLKYADSAVFYEFVFSTARDDEEGICAAFARLLLKRRDLIYRAENRKKCVLSLLGHIRSDEKVILFAVRIDQADEIYNELRPLYGNLITHYHSEMPAQLRSHNLSRFRIGEARILISCKALDEGLDVPDASIGIVMSSTAVTRQRIQRLGRILRKNQKKEMAVLYYIYASGTNEDQIYLQEISDVTADFKIHYDGNDLVFFSDDYSRDAIRMFRKLPASLSDAEKKEIGICLEEGLMRADSFLPIHIINQNIKDAKDRHEKNYWIVMKKMAEISQCY